MRVCVYTDNLFITLMLGIHELSTTVESIATYETNLCTAIFIFQCLNMSEDEYAVLLLENI